MDVIFRSTDTPTQNAAIKSRGIVDELVLLNLKKPDSPVFLNPVAALIWQLLDGHRSIAEISRLIAAEFDIAPPMVESDIIDLLYQLQSIQAVFNEPL